MEVVGTEPSLIELAQEGDIDPPQMQSNDVDPMQEDLLNEIYQNTTDVSHTIP